MRSVKVFLTGKIHGLTTVAFLCFHRAAKENDALRGCEWRVVAVVKEEFSSAGSDRPHCSKQGVDDMLAPAFQLGGVCQVALEDRRQREPVGKIKGAERSDGQIDVDRIETVTKFARVAAARKLGRVVRDSATAPVTGFDKARTASPLVLAVDAKDETAWGEERFGPISFVVKTADTDDSIARAAESTLRKGAITAALYSTDEKVIDAAAEYDECLLKARVLAAPRHNTPDFQLIEALRWTPEEGFFLLDLHLARLADSAEYFGFVCDRAAVMRSLSERAGGLTGPSKMRLLLDRGVDGLMTDRTDILRDVLRERGLWTTPPPDPTDAPADEG